ncbi:hypothetical protein SLJ52_003503 [Pseudomonas aeruginosa]|uniref:DUF7673 family protein n=1 Tax=Pseudomonas aeruginosa TaxID=287 RepID=UPI0010686349|nr:hypothetical protein [Pseudomonas aeruginosa]EKQ5877259.1 hypothetical protein [Pseudomonas aeruginosa]ELC8327448.1 hypothetical protein [Pseudomonas aeruginosa]ELX9492991.1 hypothetical protein [Pseudomonas aeruginosa]MBG4629075.1 hypothetical protein [Pseudomonas aeruginosa]MBG6338818.1 hypothetical protein [Pseudomonas aeruginosa]
MATMDLDTRAALERLIVVALGDTGQSRHVADLLLAWLHTCENGGFDPASLWVIDDALVADSLRLITWIAHNRAYPNELGYGDTFEALWRQWRAHSPLL